MADAEDFGEDTETAAKVEAWVDLIKQGQRATRGYRFKPNTPDRMRPLFGSNKASSEGDD